MKLVLLAVAAAAAIGLSAPGPGSAAQSSAIDPADFQSTIDHPLFPLSSLGLKVFEGEEEDPDAGEVVETRLESRVLAQTETVAGVDVTVLEEKAYADGELVEVALDYFAQHRDGSVYYFGERVDNYEDGQLKDHEGQWLAGEGQNEPGIIMPAQPAVGQTFEQERAPGIAEDSATVLSLTETVTVPAGTYTGCLKTRDFNPLTPGIEEFKFHCPGVGLVREEAEDEVLELVSVEAGARGPAATSTAAGAATPAPALAIERGVIAPNTGGGTPESGRHLGWAIMLAAALGTAAAAAGWLGLVQSRQARG